MSRTDGLYGTVQRRLIKEMFRLAACDNKKNILRAFAVAEKIAPDNHKYEVRFVREKVEQDLPALKISRHVLRDLSPTCRDGFINGFVVNALLRGSQKRQDFARRTGHATPFTVIVGPTMPIRRSTRQGASSLGDSSVSSAITAATSSGEPAGC